MLHVFGHTFATPHVFYYRQLVTVNPNYRYWTAWEKVPLDIEADEVLPVIWNRRLYLFWSVFTEQASNNKKITLARLAWSEDRQGKWSAKQVTATDQAIIIDFAISKARLAVENNGDELIIMFILSVSAYWKAVIGATTSFGIDKNGTVIDNKK